MSQEAQTRPLEAFGWSTALAESFEQLAREGLVPGRVIAQHRGGLVLATERGEIRGEPSGRLRHGALGADELPAVGDWVAARPSVGRAIVELVLPRRTSFKRLVASDGHRVAAEQVVAANVDVTFLVSSLTRDLNLRRLERYLATAWESGADPVVVLSKRDLCTDVESAVVAVESVAMGVPVHPVGALTGEGVGDLRAYFRGAGDSGPRTVAVLGSSGVGKSTLINALLGEERLTTAAIRADGRGRHTTTAREIVPVPGGGLVLDTPGMRELGLWDAAEGLDGAFADVTELAEHCRFADCGHGTEPDCAVREALARGALDAARLASYERLQRELHWVDARRDNRMVSEQRKKLRRQARSRRKTSW